MRWNVLLAGTCNPINTMASASNVIKSEFAMIVFGIVIYRKS